MAGHIKTPMLGDPMPKELKAETKGLFRGIHVFVSGGTWDWYRPIYPGDRLFAFGGEETLDVKQSEFAGRSVVQVRRDVVLNQRGEVVGVYRILRILTERKASRNRGKYADIEPAQYTDEDYERIDAIYAQEAPRGAEKRYWEDVAGRRRAAADGQGPVDRHRDDRVPRRWLRLRAVRVAVVAPRLPEPQADRALLRQERAGRVGRRPASPLGLAVGEGDRQPDGLRLRRDAPVLVLPPRLGLGRRRRVRREALGLDPQVQLHGRHAVPVRGGRRRSARRTAVTSSTSSCAW